MSEIPEDLFYNASHEWIAQNEDGTVTVGITEYAQDSLGDLVFAELPETGEEFDAEDIVATVESVKAASDIYAPIAGEITGVNEALEQSPEKINEDPFGAGWLFKMQISDESQLSNLLDADAYARVVADEG